MSQQKEQSTFKNEKHLQNRIMIEVSLLGHTVFRNNTGVLKDERGIPVRFGLCVGSSDLIGWTSDGRFLAIEVKMPGKNPSRAQLNFIDAVNDSGGLAFVARNIEDITLHLKK
jgi:hypothetical protein